MDKKRVFSTLLSQYRAVEKNNVLAYGMAARSYYKMFSELPHEADRPKALEFYANGTSVMADLFGLQPEQAVEYLRSKGYRITFNWNDTLAAAERRAFTVAKVMCADMLQSIRDELVRALENGNTFREFQKNIEPVLTSAGWFGRKELTDPNTGESKTVTVRPSRLKNIYRTNMSSSYAKGRFMQAKAAQKTRPYWQYVSIIDGATTSVCRKLNDKVFAADDALWKKYTPPNHYGCRATWRTLSDSQLIAEGLKTEEGKYYEDGNDETHAQGFNNSPYDDVVQEMSTEINYDNDIQTQLKLAFGN